MRLKLLLAPAAWFQGAQSTITGGSSVRNGATWRLTWELEQITPWVLMTALGMPVEPEVNRNLAMVSRPTREAAASTAPRRLTSPRSDESSRMCGDAEAPRIANTGTEAPAVCSIALL